MTLTSQNYLRPRGYDESSAGNKKLAMIMKVCTIFNANNSRVWECIISVASANGMSPARDSSRRGNRLG